jgi:TPR repeat protein
VRFLFLSGIMTPSVFRHTLLVVCLGFIAICGFGTLGFAVDSAPVLLSKTGGGTSWSTVAELTAAAEGGNAKARAQLGEMLLRGGDVPQDGPRALALLEQAARAGEASAAFRLGMLLESGDSVAEDRPRAVAYLRAAAAGGVAEAFRNVGVAYSTGRGVKRDYAEALAWFILAEKHGTADTVAADLRAFLTKQRRTDAIAAGERRAPELARELAQTDVAKALPSPAPLATNTGNSAASDEPPVKIVAPSGRVLTWTNLAVLQRAADQGAADALAALGQLQLEGKLVREDTKAAVATLERGAKAGSADAAQLLGDLYTKGIKVIRDPAKAFAYTLQAARGGVRTAIFNLGALYANGTGTKTDYTESLAWLIVAKHFNLDSGSLGRIRDYLAKADAKQIPLAERRAAERIKEIEAARARQSD